MRSQTKLQVATPLSQSGKQRCCSGFAPSVDEKSTSAQFRYCETHIRGLTEDQLPSLFDCKELFFFQCPFASTTTKYELAMFGGLECIIRRSLFFDQAHFLKHTIFFFFCAHFSDISFSLTFCLCSTHNDQFRLFSS